ncbi:hypothetical protein [Salinilacihabitans rarus]|uniref:hypothetical protein n=1 Tax=Salinilacihabitans rarus TaxID=2961596 RepID=UPI0020C8455E|nr:hypothetical protein [Salinilacihabitans rarus]
MRRRRLLATTAVCAAAGCLSEPSNANDPAENGADDDGATFAVDLDRPPYVVSMDERLPEVARANAVTPAADLNDAAAAAVETAIEADRYETADPDEALLDGLFRLQYVEVDGTIYEVDRKMPEHVVSGTEVPEREVDPDRTIGLMDDRIRALGVDNREIVGAVVTVVRRDGPTGETYRATALDGELDAFLETYDHVAYPDDGDDGPAPEGYVELAYAYEEGEPPYWIELEAVPPEERYGAPVTDVAAYPDAVADLLREAAERRTAQVRDLPAGLREAVADEGYVRLEDRVYEPELREIDHEAVPVTVAVRDVDEADRSLALAVETDREDVRIFSGAPAPFGVLNAVPADGDERALLWSDAYEASDHVHVDETGGSVAVNDIGLTTTLDPGEPTSETYEARPEWGFDAGAYVVETSLSVEWGDRGDGASASYPFSLTISVPESRRSLHSPGRV